MTLFNNKDDDAIIADLKNDHGYCYAYAKDMTLTGAGRDRLNQMAQRVKKAATFFSDTRNALATAKIKLLEAQKAIEKADDEHKRARDRVVDVKTAVICLAQDHERGIYDKTKEPEVPLVVNTLYLTPGTTSYEYDKKRNRVTLHGEPADRTEHNQWVGEVVAVVGLSSVVYAQTTDDPDVDGLEGSIIVNLDNYEALAE